MYICHLLFYRRHCQPSSGNTMLILVAYAAPGLYEQGVAIMHGAGARPALRLFPG
jgi:hypothetical protein